MTLRFVIGVLALATVPGPIDVLAAEPAPAPDAGNRLELLGDVAGVRPWLDERGAFVQLMYDQYFSAKPAGGGADRDADLGHSGSYDAFLGVDLQDLVGWTGASLLVHIKGQYDRSVNSSVGALSSPIDDADFDEPIYVDELWLQQNFLADRLRFRLGFLEQQTAFDRNAYANSEDRQFLSTYLDNNGLVPLANGLGALIILVPTPGVEVALGVADADNRPRSAGFDTAFDGPESLTGYLELELRSPLYRRGLDGAYRFGMFVDGRRLTHFRTGRSDRGHLGGYASFDQLVWRERDEGLQGLGLFARGGYADRDVNRISGFWSVGLQYTGLVPWRDADVMGIGSYQALGSRVYRDEVTSDFRRETGIEIYYAIAASSWLVITPDIQYIFDPGGTGEAGDVFVATLRIRLRF
jgi:porin